MPLLTLSDVSIGFRGPTLLESVSCQIDADQRIGLLGRNGAGKTTLMRMILGEVQPDKGELRLAADTRVAFLSQDVPDDLTGKIAAIVQTGVSRSEAGDAETEWKQGHAVDQILSRMSLDGEAEFATLSSGMKRRVLLARALVGSPDLLLLDEPTNHLDIDSIVWLEEFLIKWRGTLLFVTHDRMFLRKLATRILEIDRGQLFDWSCDYDTFLKRKSAALEAEDKQNALFDKKLAQEEAWIRQGIKARRTRNEGRVRALEAMRRQRRERQSSPGQVNLRIDEGARSGALVAKANNVSFAYGDQTILRDFSTTIMRGDKVGLIGPNGAGKSTLLRVLLGQLEPQSGTVRLGTNIELAYFDQLRGQLDDELTVQENVGEGSDTVRVGGQSKHVIGYLQDFLFDPERARTPVKFLSGGERNRVLLAKLFAKPANVIVLDEPTNDLDSETLELLEDRLVDYDGTLLLVSHDRAFLNNVVTSSIVFEPTGVKEYVGGYDDWLRQRPEQTTAVEKPKSETTKKPRTDQPEERSTGKRKLTYKEQREFEALPESIDRLETEIHTLHQTMADPDFYQQGGDAIADATAKLKELEDQLAESMHRWEELDARSSVS